MRLLQDLATREGDPYVAYMGLYALWCSNNSAVQELRPLFQIEDVYPDSVFSVTPEFREKACALAAEVLLTFPTDASLRKKRTVQSQTRKLSQSR
jgi:hypothetical protein